MAAQLARTLMQRIEALFRDLPAAAALLDGGRVGLLGRGARVEGFAVGHDLSALIMSGALSRRRARARSRNARRATKMPAAAPMPFSIAPARSPLSRFQSASGTVRTAMVRNNQPTKLSECPALTPRSLQARSQAASAPRQRTPSAA